MVSLGMPAIMPMTLLPMPPLEPDWPALGPEMAEALVEAVQILSICTDESEAKEIATITSPRPHHSRQDRREDGMNTAVSILAIIAIIYGLVGAMKNPHAARHRGLRSGPAGARPEGRAFIL